MRIPFTPQSISRRGFLASAGAAAAAGASGQTKRESKPLSRSNPDSKPNVVVMVLDSLRADHLGCYGYDRNTSPFIDSLAREGVRFDNMIAQSSYTRESVSSYFTGLNPTECGGAGWVGQPSLGTTMAEHFKKAGYRTGMFSASNMIKLDAFRRGFDTVGFPNNSWAVSRTGPEISAKGLNFIKQADGEPFFTYLHYIDPHGPYDPPRSMYLRFAKQIMKNPLDVYKQVRPQLNRLRASGFGPGEHRFEDMVNRYDAEICHSDYAVSELFDALDDMGQLDNTIVVLMADHGEEFLDHGFVEHAWRLYSESTRVPFIVWYPRWLRPRAVTQATALVDLLPTLLTLAGLEIPQERSGEALFQKLDDGFVPRITPKPIISELMIQSRNLVRSIVMDDWKYVAALKWHDSDELPSIAKDCGARERKFRSGALKPLDVFGPTVHEELYHMPDDPRELANLALSHEAMLDGFRGGLEQYYAHCKQVLSGQDTRSAPAPEDEQMTPEEREQMEALGYI